MTSFLDLLLCLGAVPLLLCGLYLLLIVLVPGRRVVPSSESALLRFDVLVPAHNEAAVIERTVASLRRLQWPAGQFRILVIADNCDDNTAELARQAKAEVLERFDTSERGKGYALKFAYARSAADGFAQAVVVVDADTEVSTNLLASCAACIGAGAEAVQARYGVLNASASWRTRLMTVALALFNRLRPRGRHALGGSSGLRGNGMCFTHALLQRVPHRAYSLVEDLEYGIHLAEAGVPVWFADDSEVLGEMVSGEEASRSQRQRWEGGRAQMAGAYAGPLLRRALLRRDLLALDAAIDLLVPPLAYFGLLLALLMLLSGGLSLFTGAWLLSLKLGLVAVLLLVLHVLAGVAASGLGWRGLLDLGFAPAYLVWKLIKARPTAVGAEWIRTRREEEDKP